MKPANDKTVTSSVAHQAALIAGLLLFVNGVTAQDAFEDQQAASDSTSSDLNVEISDDLVTLKARDVGVQDVLEEIARQSDLVVVLREPLDRRLTLEIHRLPLSEALRRILRGESFVLHNVTGVRNASHERPSTLWVFSTGSVDQSGDAKVVMHASSDTGSAIEVLQLELMSGDIRIRQAAVKALRRLEVKEAIAPLSVALSDEVKRIRVKAINALAAIGGNEAAGALAAALGDENVWVREETAYALGIIGNDSASQILEQALHDPDNDVREAAIEAFADIGGDESARALAITLYDENVALRAEVVDALGEIGGETAIRLLQHALTDQESSIREAAAEELADISR